MNRRQAYPGGKEITLMSGLRRDNQMARFFILEMGAALMISQTGKISMTPLNAHVGRDRWRKTPSLVKLTHGL
jgi:hypothetical protein